MSYVPFDVRFFVYVFCLSAHQQLTDAQRAEPTAAAPWMYFLAADFDFETLPANFSLRKCCAESEFYSYIDEKCLPTNSSSKFADKNTKPRLDTSRFRIHAGLECLKNSSKQMNYYREPIRELALSENGSLRTLFGFDQVPKLWRLDQYCLDVGKEMPYPVMFVCLPVGADDFAHLLFKFMYCVSVGLWTVTLCIYVATPELRRRVYDKSLIGFLFFGCLSLVLFLIRALIDFRPIGMKTRLMSIIVIYHIVMMSYSWLHSMCIHLWRTVTKTSKISGRSFRIYAWYSTTVPVVGFIAFCVDLRITGWETFWYRYFWGGFFLDPKFLYFLHFCAVQQIVNIVLFVHVTYVIFLKKNWKGGGDSQKHVKRQRKTATSRLIRLSIIMGLDWINIFFLNYVNTRRNMSNIFYFILHINLCPGFVLFMTFFCYNKKVISILKKKFPRTVTVALKITKIFLCFMLFTFLYYIRLRWGKVGQNILVI